MILRLSIISFLFSLIAFTSFAQPYKNLVLEGGGIRGIAYAGAIEMLEQKGITKDIKNVAGTSVGALVGCLFAVGYMAEDLRTILDELRIQEFNDGKGIFLGGFNRINRKFGWYRGEPLERWLGKYIAAKTGSEHTTFRQLGLKLERPEQIEVYKSDGHLAPYQIVNFRGYVAALYNVILEGLNRTDNFEEERFRTVYISTANINPRVKHISTEDKKILYANGRKAVEDFFR